jgi:hypothetical protein
MLLSRNPSGAGKSLELIVYAVARIYFSVPAYVSEKKKDLSLKKKDLSFTPFVASRNAMA